MIIHYGERESTVYVKIPFSFVVRNRSLLFLNHGGLKEVKNDKKDLGPPPYQKPHDIGIESDCSH
jgi:hypothetical protein